MSYKNAQNNTDRSVYNEIHDSFTKSSSFDELRRAAVKAEQIIRDNNLDQNQKERLEQYGIKRFNEIQRTNQQLSMLASTNKFKR